MKATTSPVRVAFLGIGLMGQPMASRLLRAGYPLTVWNRTPAKAMELEGLGANVADTPAAAASQADIVITMLGDGAAVAAVIDLAAAGLRTGMLVIDMSSTRQAEAQALHAKLQALGVAFIDAPVSGGVVGAEAGSLAIMAGGAEQDFARVEALLQVLGRPTLVGPAGCGQLAKLCNQLIVGGTLNIVAEALLLAQAGGADPVAVRAAIRGGFAESRILEVHGQRMLERNFLPGGQVKSQTKDLENVLVAAVAAGIRLPVTELVTERYRSILAALPLADQSAALLALERINPGVRVGTRPDQLP
ncbi:NAD(P)-dependent oxidoreductase [Noviherbaspirillum sedimenti]|uniref:NAD(P)-dependent oxidoreductase n=1 Tax=Noviherbaspirillum sedimenti TaxID=2320865 RepID=A0A3A3G1D8_9BURK|nr:NAD(P)-dependent oxidoreductase [Noviherbaspirillum sedimenti]RJG02253.1 NAD(P)-dependent oxidoreductase [Noviherbaspirillum sedimenti]